jgi:hypothetical protein
MPGMLLPALVLGCLVRKLQVKSNVLHFIAPITCAGWPACLTTDNIVPEVDTIVKRKTCIF